MSTKPLLLGKTNLVTDHQAWYERVGKYYLLEQPELITPPKIRHHHAALHRK